jgi:4-amino-4-deoxy-L-arabinose transferase-like glycosyltransferase
MSELASRLSWKDYGLLVLFCLILFSFPLFYPRVFTTHETVHCQNVREMLHDGDWIIPHYGGRVWMERPPLPFWITASFVKVFGDHPFSYRLPPLVLGTWCVLLVAWMASVWYGRNVGIGSGLMLATMQEFTHYSTGPEADMFLCAVVTSAVAFFVYLEFRLRPTDAESLSFFGARPWALLGFFAVLGLTNIVKGLFFGTIFVCLPITVFLLWNADLRALRRYIWLPGWLAFLAVGSLWAVAAYWQYPGVVDFWKDDYGNRVNKGYMAEAPWYYFLQWPWIVFPWPFQILVGFFDTGKRAWQNKAAPERFLWCWALAPILFFSIPQGKHHHYLLQTMAPWAVLGALGWARLWNWYFAGRLQGYSLRWLVATCSALVVVYWGAYALLANYANLYREDTQFLQAAREQVPAGERILVMDDDAPLNASWLLYYLEGRAKLLHNITFLRSDDIPDTDVYLIVRQKEEAMLSEYGTFQMVLASEHSRYQNESTDRYALYRLRLFPNLKRVPGPVPINPLQATGRAPGPYLQ